jgi:hypothetical protein
MPAHPSGRAKRALSVLEPALSAVLEFLKARRFSSRLFHVRDAEQHSDQSADCDCGKI